MQNRIKRAQANIISVVSIIALIILIAGIVFYSLNKSAAPALSPVSCAEESISPSIEISSACLDSSKSQVQVKLKRKITSEDLATLDFSLTTGSTKAKWRCFAGCGDCEILNSGEEKTYYLNLDENPSSEVSLEIDSNGCKSTVLSKQSLPSC